MFKAIGAVLFFSIYLSHNLTNANECSKYLSPQIMPSGLILNSTTLILPDPQFISPEAISNQVVTFIKSDSQSILYKDVNVIKVSYDETSDEISFIVEYSVDIPFDHFEIVLTKKGQFEFNDLGQIVGFSLNPVFQLQPPGFLSEVDNSNYNTLLAGYLQKSNFWNTKNKYLFLEPREIFATEEALTELPALTTTSSAMSLAKFLEASIWQTLDVDLKKRFDSIEVNNFDSGEFGQGSFDVIISLDDEMIEHTGYRIISRVHIFKNSFKMSILKDNLDDLDIPAFEPFVRQRLLDYRTLFFTTNPFKKYKFEIQ